MRVIALNGSPRKNWNTATLLQKALEGAKGQGAETELIHLYELSYRGCTSCFSCKRKGGRRGVCAMQDDLTPVLEKLRAADAILFGSPIYFMNLSSSMSACLERFLFPGTIYHDAVPTVFKKSIATGFIYTMNMTAEQVESYELKQKWDIYHFFTKILLGIQPKVLYAYDTYQFPDYAAYESSKFSVAQKEKQRAEQFPVDCEQAFALGAALAGSAAKR